MTAYTEYIRTPVCYETFYGTNREQNGIFSQHHATHARTVETKGTRPSKDEYHVRN